MSIKFPDLPYSLDALEPHISKETLSYHYNKHHRNYVEKVNSLIKNTPFADKPLESILKEAKGEILNNAAQAWNHNFYWHCMSPQGGGEPSQSLQEKLAVDFGSWEKMKEEFIESAKHLFGSGWVWLTIDQEGSLNIETLQNEGNPLRHNKTPLLTCDLWEHAFYLDYQNEKENYFKAFFKVIHWDFIEKSLK